MLHAKTEVVSYLFATQGGGYQEDGCQEMVNPRRWGKLSGK
jgi:hypothetical protein